MEARRCLVTGANGQLGQCLQVFLSEKQNRQQYTDVEFLFETRQQLDITNEKLLRAYFSKNKITHCFNFAAYTDVKQAELTPEIAYKVNAEAVLNLCKLCKEFDIILLHISTDYVFDGNKKTPYTVLDEPNPVNEYGKSKLEGEKYIQQYLEKYYIVRTSWLYSDFGNNFKKTILKLAEIQKEIYVTDQEVGKPTDGTKLVKFFLGLVLTNKLANFGLYHFAGDKVMSWYEFAKQIVKESQFKTLVYRVEEDLGTDKNNLQRPKYSVLKSS